MVQYVCVCYQMGSHILQLHVTTPYYPLSHMDMSASEMTYIVSSGALNSTHSCTPIWICSSIVQNREQSIHSILIPVPYATNSYDVFPKF